MKIIGKKVNLRSIRITDAQSVTDNISKNTVRFMDTMPFPYYLKHAKFFIRDTQKKMRKKEVLRLGIEDKVTKKIIGMIGLEKIDMLRKKAEIGYWLGDHYHRQGIMSEALSLLINHAFKELKLGRLYGRVAHKNVGSAKALEKAGFKSEGRLRKHMSRDGKVFHDELRYGLLKQEYKKK